MTSPNRPGPTAVPPGPVVPPGPATVPSGPPTDRAALPPTAAAPRPPLPPTQGLGHAPAAPVPRASGGFRGGFGRGLGTGMGFAAGVGAVLVALQIFAMVGLLVLGQLLSGASSASDNLATVWGPATAKHTMRGIYVTGSILGSSSDGSGLSAGTYGYEVAEMIDGLGRDDAEGLVLIMNTPGGTIYGAKAIADAVTRYRERTGRKVVAYVEAMSASGGMYAMAGSDYVIADHGTLVGSIGVIAGPFSRYRDVTKVDGGVLAGGVEAGSVDSQYLTQGKGKDFGFPYRDMTDEERAVFTAGMAREYAAFVDTVAQGRSIPAQTIRDEIGAYLYDPQTAKDKRLVDEVLGKDAGFRKAAELNGLDPSSTRVAAVEAPGLLSQLLGAEARAYGTAPAVTPQGGQPARVTSVMCHGAPLVLAWHGDLTPVCG